MKRVIKKLEDIKTVNDPLFPETLPYWLIREEIIDTIQEMGNIDKDIKVNTLVKKYGMSRKYASVYVDYVNSGCSKQHSGKPWTYILFFHRELSKSKNISRKNFWEGITGLKNGDSLRNLSYFTDGTLKPSGEIKRNYKGFAGINIEGNGAQGSCKSLIPEDTLCSYKPCEVCPSKGTPDCTRCLILIHELKELLKVDLKKDFENKPKSNNTTDIGYYQDKLSASVKVPKSCITGMEETVQPVIEVNPSSAENPDKMLPFNKNCISKIVGVPINSKTGNKTLVQKRSLKDFIPETLTIECRHYVKSDEDCWGRTSFINYEDAFNFLENYKRGGDK